MSHYLAKLRRWRDVAVSRRQLARFDSRILDDLGMVRGDIDRVVRLIR